MTKLYSELAGIYHEMYKLIFNYDGEFRFYDDRLKKHHCRKILEIGCGSGMLARRFLAAGYDYLGVDLYDEMLDIARKETGSDRFVRCDMRDIDYTAEFDAVMITGRSLAYVIDNPGVLSTLRGIQKALKEKGIMIFGVFESNGIFENFGDFEQTINCGNKTVQRISHLEMNLATGWTYDWHATYIIRDKSGTAEYEDLTTLRAFTKDEILLFLKLTGFEATELIEEPKVMTIVAAKRET
jgi:SAM-dependent methyltransferase